jgi:hypothetical protein
MSMSRQSSDALFRRPLSRLLSTRDITTHVRHPTASVLAPAVNTNLVGPDLLSPSRPDAAAEAAAATRATHANVTIPAGVQTSAAVGREVNREFTSPVRLLAGSPQTTFCAPP